MRRKFKINLTAYINSLMENPKRKYLNCEVGQRFNRLVILDIFKEGNYWRVSVECDCGKIKVTNRHSVVSGRTLSCGCFSIENTKRYFTGRPSKCRKEKSYAGITAAIGQIKNSAKIRGIDYLLTREEATYIMIQNCTYCNQTPNQNSLCRKSYKNHTNDGFNHSQFIHNGIDRVNSDIGYKLENCVPCCGKCNVMKKDYSIINWIEHLEKILKNKQSIFDKLNNR